MPSTYSVTLAGAPTQGFAGAFTKVSLNIDRLENATISPLLGNEVIAIKAVLGDILVEQQTFPITPSQLVGTSPNTADVFVKFANPGSTSFTAFVATGASGGIAIPAEGATDVSITVLPSIAVDITTSSVATAELFEVTESQSRVINFTATTSAGAQPTGAFIHIMALNPGDENTFFADTTLLDINSATPPTSTSTNPNTVHVYTVVNNAGAARLTISPDTNTTTWANVNFNRLSAGLIPLGQIAIYNRNITLPVAMLPPINVGTPTGLLNFDDIPGTTISITIPASANKGQTEGLYYLVNDTTRVPINGQTPTLRTGNSIVQIPKSAFRVGSRDNPGINTLQYVNLQAPARVQLSTGTALSIFNNQPINPELPDPNGVYTPPLIFGPRGIIANISVGDPNVTPLTCPFPNNGEFPLDTPIELKIFINAFRNNTPPNQPNTPFSNIVTPTPQITIQQKDIDARRQGVNGAFFLFPYDPSIFNGLTNLSNDPSVPDTATVVFQWQNLTQRKFSIPTTFKLFG